MKKFLYALSIFLIILTVLGVTVDLYISKNLQKSKTYAAGEYLVWNDIYNSKINADMLIYGSSRAWVHFNPKIIEDSLKLSCYNLGIDGQNFWFQYLRHKEYLKHNKPPKYIIVSLDAFSLENEPDLYNFSQFLPYMMYNVNIYKGISIYNYYTLPDFTIPLIRYFGKKEEIEVAKKQFFNSYIKAIPARYKGYKGQDKKWNLDFQKAKEKLKSITIKIDTNSVQLFENFIEECKIQNIEIYLIYSPEYIKGQQFVKNRKDIISLYSNIADKHSITFLDFSNNPICFNQDYFYNSSHLNISGSTEFTKIVANKLKGLVNK